MSFWIKAMSQLELEARLARWIGLDAGTLGSSVLGRAIGRRLKQTTARDLTEYVELVDRSPQERRALIDAIVVRESWFFRHGPAFEVLGRQASRTLGARRSGPFRVLSVPCASGEEPYSAAITLLEAGYAPDRIRIDAIDVSVTAIEQAQAGRYSQRAVRSVPKPLLARYFTGSGPTWDVAKRVRDCVRFQCGNILELTSVGLEPRYDTIFCRNLLIYQTLDARERILDTLCKRLDERGVLFVGHAESMPIVESRFDREPTQGAFAYQHKRREPQETTVDPAPHLPASARSERGPEASTGRAVRSRPARPLSPRAASAPSRPIEGLMEQARRLANEQKYDACAALCGEQIARYGPSAEAFHVMGLAMHASGRDDEAQHALERALYLDPEHEETLMILAVLARRRGHADAAQRLERRAARASQRGDS